MVHSHGVRGGVVNLAPMTLGSSSMVGGWGTSGLHGRLHAFVKRALLQQLVSPGASVCDLFCGRGTDIANWAQAGIGNYIGIDLSASALEEAKEQWEKHGHPFPATFQELDPCTGNLEILQDAGLPVDVVSCFAHLQDCFASEGMVRLLLRNVVSLLKPGGYFFGTTPDSSTIWYKYQKAVEEAMKVGSLRVNGTLPRVKSSLYTITFEDDRFHFFGSKYQLRFVDGLPAQMQQLVHFPSFIRVAEEVGLEFVEIQNLTEFYDDYRVPFASTLQSSCKNLLDQKGQPMVDSRGKLSMVATDVLSLYSTFIFKKSTRIVHPTLSLDFQFNTECQLDTDPEESSLNSDTPTEMSQGYELTPENIPKDSPPRINRTVFSQSSEDELSCQEDRLDTVRVIEGSPEHTMNDSITPARKIESSPQQVIDTPIFEQFSPYAQGNLLSDTDHFEEIDYFAENKSSELEDRDRSGTVTLSEDFEDVFEKYLSVPEKDTESMALAGREEHDQRLEDGTAHDEEFPILPQEFVASPQSQRTPRKGRMNRRRRTARNRRSASTASIDPAVIGQTCSVNYQSEVEQEPVDEALEISVPAPPPFLFYQRKKRSEAGDGLPQEASFSVNIINTRALRPRRSSSVGDTKSAPAMAKATRSAEARSRTESLIASEEAGGLSSDGDVTDGRGKARGKAKAALKDAQPKVSKDAGNGRRSTRSSSIMQGTGDNKPVLPEATPESSTMTTRLTRRSSLRSSF
ncbi:hypothetical protein KC19_1G299000 [Ceratodon purpureus]|uniref:mRNA (guanine-N(7))-methyltransferase n=1 Tax=Ceratodon purpureus TaxID=3225 RepID=A0A8T0JEB3_CERPU|nr:hypothetical protein KC19_1G299000 [Ceratodon purpureus]